MRRLGSLICRIVLAQVGVLSFICTTSATTWYIRSDGGSRYSKNVPTGQCDGKSDAAYPGKGQNRHCAFNDFRYLYSDGTANNKEWVIVGGDTVIVRDGPWRVGYKGPNPKDYFGNDPGSPYSSFNPPIPAGTAEHHTRILGKNYEDCASNQKTQLFGGFAVDTVLNLRNTEFVDIQCIEITDHAQCGRIGAGNVCNSDYPLGDFAKNGIITNTGTKNIWLTDVDVHGLASRGILGPIGGDIHATRLRIAFNTGAGWDLDNGSKSPSTGGTITLQSAVLEWNGCTEEYPIIHSIPAYTCWDQNSGGYGDAIGSSDGDQASFMIKESIFRYNTQDGPDLLHSSTGTFVIENSASYGNMGQQLKLGATLNSSVRNSVFIHNCNRLSVPMSGAPANYNIHLSNFCRASGDGLAIGWGGAGTTMHFDNNTYVGYGNTSFDIFCTNSSSCAAGTKTFRNNVFIGYALKGYNSSQLPGMFCYSGCNGTPNPSNDSMWTARSNNVFYNMRHCPAGHFAQESCRNPQLISVPKNLFLSSPDQLDYSKLDLHPALGGFGDSFGTHIEEINTDYEARRRPSRPSIGALEPER